MNPSTWHDPLDGLYGYDYAAQVARLKAAAAQVKAAAAQVKSAPAKPKVDQFAGVTAEFAAGVVTGTRSFSVDRLGRLTGVTYKKVWRPGENVAKCYRSEDHYHSLLGGTIIRTSGIERTDEHAMTECDHGFYAYYEGSNDFYEEGRIMGVIEGYGETLIGTRGFRASKARIVALHIPEDVEVAKRRLISRNYPDIPQFGSFEAMVEAFPPDDAGQGINPANDPDFWEREA
jgi:hypothetical protein